MKGSRMMLRLWLPVILAPALARADAYTLVQQYVAPAKLATFYFGSSGAIIGNRVALGSPFVYGQEPDEAGALFFYDRTSGALLGMATSPSPQEDGYLGSVTAAIGGDFWTNDLSATRIFDGVTGFNAGGVPYQATALLVNNSLAAGQGLAVVGDASYFYTIGEWSAGAVHVLDATTRAAVRLIENPDHGAGDQFGQAVAVGGSYLVVGAPLDDPGGIGSAGSVYVYDLASGTLLHTLTSPDPAENDGFGWAVAVVGDRIAVGEPGDDTLDGTAGAAHLFDAATGAHVATMYSTHPVLYGTFG